MTQLNDDWQAFLEETEVEQPSPLGIGIDSATFPLIPDESVEDPEAHIKKVTFTKTPAFLWMLVTGGLTGFALLLFAVTSYLSDSRKVVAAAPSAGVFEEPNQGKRDLLPSTPDDSGLKPIAPSVDQKPNVTKSVTLKQPRTVMDRPSRVVYINRPSQGFTPTRVPRSAIAPTPFTPRPALPPVARPVFESSPQPEPVPEPIGALYAPDSGEGPTIEAETVASTSAQSSPTQPNNSAVDQALAIYDGTKVAQADTSASTTSDVEPSEVTTASAEVKTAPAEVDFASAEVKTTPSAQGSEPLTSEEYAKKHPQKAAKEALLARLAMIPQESKLKGQIMGMLTWGSQESFPVGEEIKILVKNDFEQFGKILVPKGSIAFAQSQKGTGGQYIMADVTRIELPDGRSLDIEPGLLTASTGDGFIEGKLKEPRKRGGVGRVVSQIGRGILTLGVASVVPEGDGFGDRVIQSVAGAGLDSVNDAMDGDRQGRGRAQIPSFYVIKPKTSIQLIANGDIQLQ
jgi:hypothetical protein